MRKQLGTVILAVLLAGCSQAPQPVEPKPVEETFLPSPVIPAPAVKSESPESPSKIGEDKKRPLVTPGAFCSARGAIGISKKGKTYVCMGPGRDRWRREGGA